MPCPTPHPLRNPAAGRTGSGLAAIGLAITATLTVPACRSDDAPPVPAARSSTVSGAAPAPDPSTDLVEFRHDNAGFALSYPKGWVRAPARDPEIVLVAAEHDPGRNQGGSILVRVTSLDAPVGRADLARIRTATDAIVESGQGVQLRAEPIETQQGGIPGLYYLYTFSDPVSGLTGAHSHFFLFKDKAMISLVFQALPDGDFSRLAPLFDRVTNSIRTLR